jgi:asparagine synthase (glutamine-hydrolysing)
MMAADMLVYLPQDILVKADRASMAFGLEVRAPFLDSELVELAFSLPRRWHRHGTNGKRMLRKALRASIPGTVWSRRKQGFAVPLGTWFHGALGERLAMLSREIDHPLNKEAISGLLAQHRSRAVDAGQKLWQIYTYVAWRSAAN